MSMQFCYDPSQPVKENDHVLLVDHNRNKFVVKVESKSYFKICKDRFNLGMLIGCHYGQMFTKYDNDWIKIRKNDERFKRYRDIIHLNEECEDEQLKDNRFFLLNNTAQKLTPDEIVQMKKDVNTFDLITKIVENSETFHARTTMAQEKYIKRKEHRHLKLFEVSHCNLMSLCESYFNSFPHKIGYMRYESMGMMFHLANIQLNDNVVVFDHSLGLLTAGVSQKLNGTGKIYRLVTKGVSDKIVHEIGINHYSNILSIDINDFFSDAIYVESDANHRHSEEKATMSGIYPLYKVNMEQLKANVIIGNISFNKCNKNNKLVEEYTTNLVKIANKHLQDDGKFVLFGQHLQPMVECYAQLNSNSYINIKLDEIFFREYQMLSMRTHPVMSSKSRPCCGLIVSAIKITNESIKQEFKI